jgi:hypothetical protein
MTRLLSSRHLTDLSKWQKCGCPDCLKADGLCLIEVWNPHTERYVRMLAPWATSGTSKTSPTGKGADAPKSA